VALNADLCEHDRQILAASNKLGWLSSGFQETYATPGLLATEGCTYVAVGRTTISPTS
jgi:hypothetical protein